MAKSTSAPRSASENARISAAALRVAGAVGWGKLTLEAVAANAKLSPTLLKKRFARPQNLVAVIAEEIDREAFAAAGKVSGAPHDALFDLLMARFDLLQIHRKAILSMAEAARRDPVLARMLACATLDGVYRLIDATAIPHPPRPALAAGIGAVYGYGFLVWRKDASRDMAKTMAAVDRTLRYAGKAAGFLRAR
jgi:AcrR family transcriptional regulator